MNYYPLFRVRSWNNIVHCMSPVFLSRFFKAHTRNFRTYYQNKILLVISVTESVQVFERGITFSNIISTTIDECVMKIHARPMKTGTYVRQFIVTTALFGIWTKTYVKYTVKTLNGLELQNDLLSLRNKRHFSVLCLNIQRLNSKYSLISMTTICISKPFVSRKPGFLTMTISHFYFSIYQVIT